MRTNMTYKNFEDFMTVKHRETHGECDNDIPDAFINWLDKLEVKDWIEYVDEYVAEITGKKYTYFLYKQDAEEAEIVVLDKPMILPEMQTFVDGYITVAGMEHGQWLICNEEGLLHGLKPNKKFPKFVGNVILTLEKI